jgi:hypothetical protein
VFTTKKPTLEGSLRATALIASAAILGMMSIKLVTGISQGPVETLQFPDEYARALLSDPVALRLTFAVDNIFLIAYTSFFLLLGAYLIRERRAPKLLIGVAIALLLLTGVLDLLENLHVVGMIGMAEQSIAIPQAEIQAQALETTLKIHVSYLGLFLLAFVYPRETVFEKTTVMLLFLLVPVGMLIDATPSAIATPLAMVRLLFLIGTFLLSARVFHDRLRSKH